MTPAIELLHVGKSYGEMHAVRDVTVSVPAGETLVLVGSSGCGKTTLLKMLNRLVAPTSGTIKLNGQDILEKDPIEIRRSMGYVIQGIGLFPHMTIEENVSLVLRLLGRPVKERMNRAAELLELVGLPPADFGSRYPDELSGGQQQRVGVARALAADPSVLLMDEPFGALDAITRSQLHGELLRLKDSLKKTIVFVTHDMFEAFILADRIAVLHEGVLQQVGTKEEIMEAPASGFVQALLDAPKKQLEKFKGVL
jgi:osmoprotectant transport system ATP-binding protein